MGRRLNYHEHKIIPNPECRDGKHRNCNTEGWDLWADEPANCPCECHT